MTTRAAAAAVVRLVLITAEGKDVNTSIARERKRTNRPSVTRANRRLMEMLLRETAWRSFEGDEQSEKNMNANDKGISWEILWGNLGISTSTILD